LPGGLLRNAVDALISAYNPLLVLVFLGAVIWVDGERARETRETHEKPGQHPVPTTPPAATEK
jgi:hypothetical protein